MCVSRDSTVSVSESPTQIFCIGTSLDLCSTVETGYEISVYKVNSDKKYIDLIGLV